MPAEWEPHRATWLSWPKNTETFPPDILPRVEEAYAVMVRALAPGEEVWMLVDDERGEARAKEALGRADNVKFVRLQTADVWVRDYGPLCVRGPDLALVKWRFNAWGGKYDDLLPDDEAGERMAASTGLRVFRPGIVFEGGSVDVDGAGSLLTTEQCLLNPNRNPGLGRAGMEGALRDNLGASEVVWLKAGIEGDDTDGHVDDVARFAGPEKVVVAAEDRPSDPNREALAEDLEVLEDRGSQKKPFDVVTLPMPPKVDSPGGRLPASHLNFYVGNAAVLVPTFGGRSDRTALKALGELFPRREVVGVDCRALVYGLGTIHCVTQQVPKSP
jgi:agmatine deiminase